MLKRSILFFAGVILVIGGYAFFKVSQIRASRNQPFAPPVATVSATMAKEEVWQRTLNAVGGLTAVQGTTLSAELDGSVVKIAFESGSVVKAGDLLVQQDVTAEEAQLASAEAQAELARVNLQRARELRRQGTNSPADLDAAVAESRAAEANAAVIRATVAKKTLRAPFSGRAGIRMVNLGQFLKGGASVVPLHTLDPIYVDFSLPQQEITALHPGQIVRVRADAFPDTIFEGEITAINPQVDPATRNVQTRATLANADGRLRPGMFVNVEVLMSGEDHFITLPATAISYNPYGDSVFILEENKDAEKGPVGLVARQQFVKVGPTRGNQVAILRGVTAGQQIATSGLTKLHNGMVVEINNEIRPSSDPAPAPADA